MITSLAVSGYRSLRDLVVPLGGLDIVTGPNGSGKSSLYRSLRLLADCASGRVVGSLASEGGLPSVLWAGPESLAGARRGHPVQGTVRKGPVSLQLGFGTDTGFSYLADLGLPIKSGPPSAFELDPEIKRELAWNGPVARPGSILVERKGPLARTRDGRGWRILTAALPAHASMLTELADPENAPELLALREQIRGWRFYDGFRVDAGAPARRAQIGTRTPVLSDQGADLAAALQTIVEIGDEAALAVAVADAFDGAWLEVTVSQARFDLALRQPGVLRPMGAAELSDGTLRFLLLVAALLTPRPPGLMVLNEPETSLHPDLYPALARLVERASRHAQVVVVSHADAFVDHLGRAAHTEGGREIGRIRLGKDLGETVVQGQGRLDGPPWHWGSR